MHYIIDTIIVDKLFQISFFMGIYIMFIWVIITIIKSLKLYFNKKM